MAVCRRASSRPAFLRLFSITSPLGWTPRDSASSGNAPCVCTKGRGISMVFCTLRSPKISRRLGTRAKSHFWLNLRRACAPHRLPVENMTDPVSGISLPTRTVQQRGKLLSKPKTKTLHLPAPFGPIMAWTEFSATLEVPRCFSACQTRRTFPTFFDFRRMAICFKLLLIRLGVCCVVRRASASNRIPAFPVLRRNTRPSTLGPPSDQDHRARGSDQHEQQTQVQCQPGAEKGWIHRDQHCLQTHRALKENQPCRTLSLILKKRFQN